MHGCLKGDEQLTLHEEPLAGGVALEFHAACDLVEPTGRGAPTADDLVDPTLDELDADVAGRQDRLPGAVHALGARAVVPPLELGPVDHAPARGTSPAPGQAHRRL